MLELSHSLPTEVIKCMRILNKNSIQCYLVGGCVRDILLGKEPDDYDITANASPQSVKECFTRSFDSGIKHGTVTVIVDSLPIEITQMRIDGKYEDNRHPAQITPTRSLKQDLLRRDFTVNSIAADIDGKIYDYCKGVEDLNRGIIRAVGNPSSRYSEDALRILRAIRFSCQLGFEIEQNTYESAIEKADLLQRISAERICAELKKSICSDNLFSLYDFLNKGCLGYLGLDCNKTLEPIQSLAKSVSVRLSALIYLCNANSNEVCNKLKLDKKTKYEVNNYTNYLVNSSDYSTEYELRRLVNSDGYSATKNLIEMIEALQGREMSFQKHMLERVKNDPVTLKTLAVNGTDLIGVVKNKRHMAMVLSYLLNLVHENPDNNYKEYLLEQAYLYCKNNEVEL